MAGVCFALRSCRLQREPKGGGMGCTTCCTRAEPSIYGNYDGSRIFVPVPPSDLTELSIGDPSVLTMADEHTKCIFNGLN